MVIKFSRAQRRHDYRRVMKKRQNHWGYGYQGWRQLEMGTNDMCAKLAGMVARTPKVTKCYCCCNPRRNDWQSSLDRLTMQERRALNKYKDDYDEFV